MSMPQPDPSLLDTLTRYVLPPLLGALAGAVGSIFAPWANWGVEKRRELNKARRAQITGFRDTLYVMRLDQTILKRSMSSDQNSSFLLPPRDFFLKNRRILPLFQYLGDDFFPDIPDGKHTTVRELKDLLERALAKVDALEKKWKLV